MGIRFAAEADAPALLAIYAQYIETGITFEYELPSREEFARRIREFGGTYPYLIWEEDGRIVGYAYAHRQAERAAYQWNAELSVYLDRAHTGTGLGRPALHCADGAAAAPGGADGVRPGDAAQREERRPAPEHGLPPDGRPAQHRL